MDINKRIQEDKPIFFPFKMEISPAYKDGPVWTMTITDTGGHEIFKGAVGKRTPGIERFEDEKPELREVAMNEGCKRGMEPVNGPKERGEEII